MPKGFLSRWMKRGSLAKPSSGTRRAVLLVFFAVFYVLGVGYQFMLWNTGAPASFFVTLVYKVVILACYGSLWLLISDWFKQRRATPASAFWHTLVLGTILFGLAYAVAQIPGGFDEAGLPLTWTTIVKMNALSLMEATFFFVLLLRFRDLVFYKRTKSSQRNWYLMLGFMVIAALITLRWPL